MAVKQETYAWSYNYKSIILSVGYIMILTDLPGLAQRYCYFCTKHPRNFQFHLQNFMTRLSSRSSDSSLQWWISLHSCHTSQQKTLQRKHWQLLISWTRAHAFRKYHRLIVEVLPNLRPWRVLMFSFRLSKKNSACSTATSTTKISLENVKIWAIHTVPIKMISVHQKSLSCLSRAAWPK